MRERTPPPVIDVRHWVSARDFEFSRRFYVDLGWSMVQELDGLAVLELAGNRLVLQDYYQRGWAENSMITVEVPDSRAWYEHATAVLNSGQYGDARVAEPVTEDWCQLVTHVWDPAGVLLHFVTF